MEDNAGRVWGELDEAWREAFRQAWVAVRGGNIGVGACASTAEGEIVREGPLLDVAYDLEDGGELGALTDMEVDQVLAALWPRLQVLRQATARPSA